MFNLLPQNLKQKIKSEYALRRMVVIFSFVIFLQVSSIVFTLPLWFISGFKEKEAVLQNIYISGINYKYTDVTTANIVIIGIANKREDLVAFVKTLEGTKVFQTVHLPVGNLAQDKNINFSIEISLI